MGRCGIGAVGGCGGVVGGVGVGPRSHISKTSLFTVFGVTGKRRHKVPRRHSLLLPKPFHRSNRRIRPNFSVLKCRARRPASIRALHAPKFALRETTEQQNPKVERNKNKKNKNKNNNSLLSQCLSLSLAPPTAHAQAGIKYAVRGRCAFPPLTLIIPRFGWVYKWRLGGPTLG